jgi:hypothetical protein
MEESMPESFTLDNIDDLINHWRNICSDIHPSNVDSMDRGNDIDDHTARTAICLIPAILEELKAHLVREREGQETALSREAHTESGKWLEKLSRWLS